MVSEDIVKVIVDYGMAKKKQRKKIDTGLFTRIYKGIHVEEKTSNVGVNFLLEGKALKKTKKNAV
jgi:hypothetical protein